jgi:hypothetical protein
MALSKNHRLFVDAFVGDPGEAARIAGYAGTPSQLKHKGNELLKDPLIVEALQERQKYMLTSQTAIADRDKIFGFWSNIMDNKDPNAFDEVDQYGVPRPKENIPLQHRLKASEMLAKGQGLFIDRVELEGKITVSDIVRKSFELPDDDLDAIEAEYSRVKELQQRPLPAPETPTPEMDLESFL